MTLQTTACQFENNQTLRYNVIMLKELPAMPQFKIFIKNRLVLISIILTLILNIIIWIILAVKIGSPVEPIALHYNIYFGIDRIGAWQNMYFLPLNGILIFIANWLIGLFIFIKESKNLILSYFFIFTALFVQLILLVASILLIVINS